MMKDNDLLESIQLLDEGGPIHYIVLKDGRLAPFISGGMIDFAIHELGGEITELEEDPEFVELIPAG